MVVFGGRFCISAFFGAFVVLFPHYTSFVTCRLCEFEGFNVHGVRVQQ